MRSRDEGARLQKASELLSRAHIALCVLQCLTSRRNPRNESEIPDGIDVEEWFEFLDSVDRPRPENKKAPARLFIMPKPKRRRRG